MARTDASETKGCLGLLTGVSNEGWGSEGG